MVIMCKSPPLAATAATLLAADFLLHHAVQSRCFSACSCWGQHGTPWTKWSLQM